MTQFAIFATLLIVVVAAFVLPPLWLGLRSPKRQADRKEANLAIFRDQQAELEREKTEGTLADADFEQARRELQRRLLEEVETTDSTTHASHGPSRKTAIAILLLLPVLALLGYGTLGNLRALDPSQAVAQPQVTPEQINGMVAKLAERMKANPDDLKGWLMLGRSYKTMGRYAEAKPLPWPTATASRASRCNWSNVPSNSIRNTATAFSWPEPRRWKPATTRKASPTGKPCCRRSSRVRKSTRCCVAASRR